ncbi:MAG: hypothetical protein QXY40_02065 [Candidatus Methanomethylicia archaeon]
MVTLHEVIREAILSFGGVASSNEIAKYINEKYPNTWKRNSIKTCLYSCSVNNPSAYAHHASTPKFLFNHGQGVYEIYDPKKHGVWSNGVKIDETQPIQVREVLDASPKEEAIETELSQSHAANEVRINPAETLKPTRNEVENTSNKFSFFDAIKSLIAKIKLIIFLIFRI